MNEKLSKPKTLKEIAERLVNLESLLITESSKVAPGWAPEIQNTLANKIVLSVSDKLGLAAQKALGGVAAVRLLLSIAVMLQLAIKTGWLIPERQIMGGIGLGLVFIILNFKINKLFFPYKQYIPGVGTGIALITVSLIWGYFSYKIIPKDTMLLGMGITSLLSVFLIYFNRGEVYLHISLIVSYATPYLLHLLGYSLNVIGSFFVGLAALFSVMALLIKQRHLHRLASYAGIGLLALIGGLELDFIPAYTGQHRTMALMLSLQFLILSLGLLGHSLYHKELLEELESWSYFPILLFFYGTLYAFTSYVDPLLSPIIAFAIALTCIILYLIANKKLGVLSSGTMIFCFASIVLFHSLYIELLPQRYAPWCFIFVLGLLPYLIKKTWFKPIIQNVFFDTLFTILLLFELTRTIYLDLTEPSLNGFMLSLCFAAALVLNVHFLEKFKVNLQSVQIYSILTAAGFTYIASLFALGSVLGEVQSSCLGFGFLVALIVFFWIVKQIPLVQMSLLTSGAILGKIFFFDGFKEITISIALGIYIFLIIALIFKTVKWNKS